MHPVLSSRRSSVVRTSGSSRSALNGFDLQYLEGRTLMAANPLGVRVVDNVLTITGTAKDDRIVVVQYSTGTCGFAKGTTTCTLRS